MVAPELLMMPTRLSSLPSYGVAFGTAVLNVPPGPAVITTLQVDTVPTVGQGTAFASVPANPPRARTVPARTALCKRIFWFILSFAWTALHDEANSMPQSKQIQF